MSLPPELQVIVARIQARTDEAVPWPSTKKVDRAFLDNMKDVMLLVAEVEKLLHPPAPQDEIGEFVLDHLGPLTECQPNNFKHQDSFYVWKTTTPAANGGKAYAGPMALTITNDQAEPCVYVPPVPVGDRGRTVTTPDGVWSFDAGGKVLLDGQPVGGNGLEFWFYSGALYLRSGDGTEWYQWNGSSFNPISGTPDGGPAEPLPGTDPVEPEPEPEPDLPLPPAPKPVTAHPRLILTPDSLTDLRAKLKADNAFRARWQMAIDQFESPTGYWTQPTRGGDAYNRTFAAFLTLVRRPDDDLGLTWQSSWQTYRDRIVSDALTAKDNADNPVGWSSDYKPHTIGLILTYDCLYHDLTPIERAEFDVRIAKIAIGSPLGNGNEVWDNGNSDGHARSILARLIAPDLERSAPMAYAENDRVVEGNSWMPLGFGLGREWHDGYSSRHGLVFLLHCLKNAGGYSDAQTFDRMGVHLRDVWMLTHLATIPHPSNDVAADPYWTSEKFHTQDTLKAFHRNLNVGSHMLWAAAVLPGAFSRGLPLDGLAKSEAAYFGYLWHVFNEPMAAGSSDRLRNITNYEQIGIGSGTQDHGKQNTFWSFPAWLIYNVQPVLEQTAEQAGVPLVRRWWPGTTDWTMVQSSHSRSIRTSLWYVHRRYGASNYEEGTRFNGSWSLHRDGPLLMRRSATGHSHASRRGTFYMNGCVSFINPSLYPEFTSGSSDVEDLGGQRAMSGNGDTKAHILANPTADYGPVTAWQDTGRVVALTSDLTRSYNSTAIRTGDDTPFNARKIARFIREFVRIYQDGSGRGKVFTYDRIELLDPVFEPRYSICPATEPDIDGTSVPHIPWAPPSGDPWTAVGPTRWDYSGATRLICDNRTDPEAPIHGNGKVCVTWLRPSGPGAKVEKRGGHNVRREASPNAAGDPHIGPWNEWHGSSDYSSANHPHGRAYVGPYTVTVAPTPVAKAVQFLMACEDMAAGETPSAATELPCDDASVAARCGSSVVVFGKDGERASGWVDVPDGVSLVIAVNLSGGVQERLVTQAGRVTFGAV